MAHCPKCGEEISINQCPWCYTVFDGATLKPLDAAPPPPAPLPPSRPRRIVNAIANTVLVLLSLAALLFGGTISYAGHAPSWLYANVGAAVLVVVIAIVAKAPRSFLTLFASLALGFASCTANFQWHGA